jgi:hypothetical protein
MVPHELPDVPYSLSSLRDAWGESLMESETGSG